MQACLTFRPSTVLQGSGKAQKLRDDWNTLQSWSQASDGEDHVFWQNALSSNSKVLKTTSAMV